MKKIPTGLVLGGAGACALLSGTARAQGVCTASDATYIQNSDCNTTQWQLGARWSDGAGGSGSDSNIGTANGNSLCVNEHTGCNGSDVPFKLYPATESFTWETSPSDEEIVEFYWQIGNQQDTTNYCTADWYDETVYVGYYSFTGWYAEWCN